MSWFAALGVVLLGIGKFLMFVIPPLIMVFLILFGFFAMNDKTIPTKYRVLGGIWGFGLLIGLVTTIVWLDSLGISIENL